MIPLYEVRSPAIYGGKAAGLGRCLRAGLPVPEGWALSRDEVAAVVANRLPIELPPGWWAVRSSAIDEDGATASFAGQHATRLHVAAEAVVAAVREVAASGEKPETRAYRARMDLPPYVGMGVVLQRMVDAEVSGVLFTRHPLTGARELVIEAAWGLGETVVAGVVIPDSYRLTPEGRVLERRAGHKDLAARPGADGQPTLLPVPAERIDALTLGDERLAQLHGLARRTIAVCGADLDLEWSFAHDGALHLLQQRPLTA